MRTTVLLSLCVVCALLLVACSKTENSNNTSTPATSSTSPKTAAPATASTTGEKIGVPECDEFIAAYDACVSSKVPETARAQYKTAIAQWRSSWSKLAANPTTKATLAAACKQSAESARASMKSYGCTF
ncbi:MAG TPA: hypothetical protein VN951_12570 [Pyrinomonadaceae bacterium]|nr:hypothetical protein [Pyrinomonadaceae bacterium]